MDNLASVTAFLYVLLELCGIGAAAHAVMNVRSSQGTIAWTLSLITFPFVSLPLYLVLGPRRFTGYVKTRRSRDSDMAPLAREIEREYGKATCPVLPASFQPWAAFERLAKLPFLCGNRVRLLIDGEATFDAIIDAVGRARDYLLVQFYIVRDDQLGRRLQRALTERARSGVRVHFLYDEVGCYQLPGGYLEILREAGCQVRPFSSPHRHTNRFRINFRNHRKVVVVDGHTAYVGGHNVGDEYLGRDPKLSPWRDTHVEVFGPAALGVQLAFLEDWRWATDQIPQVAWEPSVAPDQDTPVLVLPSGPADNLDTCSLFFVQAINAARARVWVVSPYFVPDEPVVAALQLAALRGVDVRILVPARADNLLVQLAGYSYYPETVGAGVKLYRYERGFLHQKVMLVDDQLAAVGTANLDNRSFRLNFEITLLLAGQASAEKVAGMLERDFSHSQAIRPGDLGRRPLLFRIAVKFARLFAPIL